MTCPRPHRYKMAELGLELRLILIPKPLLYSHQILISENRADLPGKDFIAFKEKGPEFWSFD